MNVLHLSLVLLNCVFPLFFLVNLVRHLSILVIFSKNKIISLLTVHCFYCIYLPILLVMTSLICFQFFTMLPCARLMYVFMCTCVRVSLKCTCRSGTAGSVEVPLFNFTWYCQNTPQRGFVPQAMYEVLCISTCPLTIGIVRH